MLMRNSNEIHNYALTRANIAPLQATTQTRRSYVTVRCKDRRHAVFECLRWRLNMARPHAPPPPSECHAAPLQHLDTLADIATARAASEQTHPLVGAVPFVAPLPSSHRVTTTGASIPECWWRPERRACAHRGHRQNVAPHRALQHLDALTDVDHVRAELLHALHQARVLFEHNLPVVGDIGDASCRSRLQIKAGSSK